ncbi:hypothetical protein EV714DRAFT_240538, partial [Schizophyllum commune]
WTSSRSPTNTGPLDYLEGYNKTVYPGHNANAGYPEAPKVHHREHQAKLQDLRRLSVGRPQKYGPTHQQQEKTDVLPGGTDPVARLAPVTRFFRRTGNTQLALRTTVSSSTLKQTATYSYSLSDALNTLSSDVHLMRRMRVLSLVMGKRPQQSKITESKAAYRCLARGCPNERTGNRFVALPTGVNQNEPTQAHSMKLLREFFSCMCGALLFKPYLIRDKCPTPGCRRSINATPVLCYGLGDKVESFAKEFGIDIPDTEHLDPSGST